METEKKEIISKDFKHSYSSVSKFKKNPSEWLMHYGFGMRSPSTPAMTRGTLAEFGTYYRIKKGMAGLDGQGFEGLIKWRFKKMKYLNAEKEIDNAIQIALAFEKQLYERQLRRIVSYQREELKNVDDLKYPIRMFTDFEFDNIIVDTKATLRMPSYPRVDHLRQQSLYATLYEKPTALLYATPKKTLWYELTKEEIKTGYEENIRDFIALENYIKACDNSLEKAVQITPLNTDPNPFEWDDNIKKEAIKIWQKMKK